MRMGPAYTADGNVSDLLTACPGFIHPNEGRLACFLQDSGPTEIRGSGEHYPWLRALILMATRLTHLNINLSTHQIGNYEKRKKTPAKSPGCSD